MAAIKFLKKLFCMEGRSPANLTNAFIQAKQNAEMVIKIIPLVLLFMVNPAFKYNILRRRKTLELLAHRGNSYYTMVFGEDKVSE